MGGNENVDDRRHSISDWSLLVELDDQESPPRPLDDSDDREVSEEGRESNRDDDYDDDDAPGASSCEGRRTSAADLSVDGSAESAHTSSVDFRKKHRPRHRCPDLNDSLTGIVSPSPRYSSQIIILDPSRRRRALRRLSDRLMRLRKSASSLDIAAASDARYGSEGVESCRSLDALTACSNETNKEESWIPSLVVEFSDSMEVYVYCA